MKSLKLTASYDVIEAHVEKNAWEPTLEGKSLPVLPESQLNVALIYEPIIDAYLKINGYYCDLYYADNENTVKVDESFFVDLMVGYSTQLYQQSLDLFLGVNNIFNESYYDHVRANAFGGRYYEPASKSSVYAGLKVYF